VQLFSGRTNVAGAITRHEGIGLDVLAGRSGSGVLSDLSAENLALLLSRLRAETIGYDIVIMDLSAGIDRTVRQIAAAADLLLVVATDEPTSLTDAYAMLKLHTADQPDGMPGSSSTRRNPRPRVSRPMRHCGGLAWRFCIVSRRSPGLSAMIQRFGMRYDVKRHCCCAHPNSAAAQDVEALAQSCLTGVIPTS